jgi:hypothetical protein
VSHRAHLDAVEKRKISYPAGNRTSIPQPVTIPTALETNNGINMPSSQTFRSYLHNQYGPGIYPKFRGPEIETSSVDWAQLSRLLPEDGDRIQSPKRCF